MDEPVGKGADVYLLIKETEEQIKNLEEKAHYNRVILKHAYGKIKEFINSSSKVGKESEYLKKEEPPSDHE